MTHNRQLEGMGAFLLGFALLLLAGAAATHTTLLPGMSNGFIARYPLHGAIIAAGFLALSLAALGASQATPGIRKDTRAGSVFNLRRGVDTLTASWACLSRTLGLRLTPRRALVFLALGVAGAAVARLASTAAASAPALWGFTASEDPRLAGVLDAPPLSRATYFAVNGGIPEELLFRGLFLAVAAAAITNLRPRTAHLIVGVALMVSSALFGLIHIEYGTVNLVSATASGLIYGSLALLTRSVYPAILAHALANFVLVYGL